MSIRINGGVEVPFIYRDNKPVQYVYIGSNLYYHKGNLTPGLVDRRLTSYTIDDEQTIIGDYAFYSCIHLSTLNISNKCKAVSFGDNAFANCVKLTSITVPNRVTKIGSGCFQNDLNLVSITINPGLSKIDAIEADTFKGCINLTSISLPPTVRTVGEQAFCSCLRLTGISLTNVTSVVDNTAFDGCIALSSVNMRFNKVDSLDCLNPLIKLEYLSVGDKITPVHVSSFIDKNKEKLSNFKTLLFNSGNITQSTYIVNGKKKDTALLLKDILSENVSIVSISLPENLTYIPASFCSRPTTKPRIQYVSISKDSPITRIEQKAFANTNITSINIPDTVQEIGSYSFFNCIQLETVNISSKSQLKRIHDVAFGFSTLSSIFIPSTVEYISPYAFNNTGNPFLTIYCDFKSDTDLPVMSTFPWSQDAKVITFVFKS